MKGRATLPAHAAVPDRAVLRANLEAARAAFHRQAEAAAGQRWQMPSPTCAWTVGEVLVHLTWALEQLPKEVEQARQGKGMFNLPKWFADPASFWMIRWQARSTDPAALCRRYDRAMDAVLAALHSLPDSDWGLGARFYGEGYYTVADLFATPADHLAEHLGPA